MDIARSVILVTAAGTPTGCAMAEHFCSLGAKVALIDSDSKQLKNTHQICKKKYSSSYPFLLTGHASEQIDLLFEKIKQQFGSIDVLINYWQTRRIPDLLTTQTSVENSMIDVASNLYLFGRCAAISMISKKKEGVIINIPGIQYDAQSEHELNSSNTVIRGLTQSWGKELEHANIRVGGVIPNLNHYRNGKIHHQTAVNYDIIDDVTYIVENDSFTSRTLEVN